uniref:Uncharacterized protein n=1 Tax=Macrostomum lignano TaxID=282301 RepID=A0A1I8JN46_9PLAT
MEDTILIRDTLPRLATHIPAESWPAAIAYEFRSSSTENPASLDDEGHRYGKPPPPGTLPSPPSQAVSANVCPAAIDVFVVASDEGSEQLPVDGSGWRTEHGPTNLDTLASLNCKCGLGARLSIVKAVVHT